MARLSWSSVNPIPILHIKILENNETENKQTNMIYSNDLFEMLGSVIGHNRYAKVTVIFPKKCPYGRNGLFGSNCLKFI